VAQRGPAVFIAQSRRADRQLCSVRLCNRSFARVASGASWTSRTTSAPWAARWGHTTVIDAAGAIYVIGGTKDGWAALKDVWASTDGGVPVLVRECVSGLGWTCLLRGRVGTLWHRRVSRRYGYLGPPRAGGHVCFCDGHRSVGARGPQVSRGRAARRRRRGLRELGTRP
jgi:hypothetical protein